MNEEIQQLLNTYPNLVDVYRNTYDVRIAAEFVKLYDRVVKAEAAIAALQSK